MEHRKKCLGNLKQMGVAPRMATAFIILIIVPYLFLASVIFWFYEKNAISNLTEATMDTITVAAAGIHSAMLEREDDSMAVYYNGCVEMLGAERTLTEQEEKQITEHLSASSYANTGVRAAYLKAGRDVFHSGGNYAEVLDVMEPYEEEIVEAGGRCLWYTTDQLHGSSYENNYILARSLNSETKKNVGILYLVLSDKMITDALGMVSTEYAEWYLTNAQGIVLYASDVSKMGEHVDVSALSLKKKRTCHTVYNEQGHDEVMVAYSLMDVGWYCISKIQLRAVRKDAVSLVIPIMVIALVCILFMLLMLYMLRIYVFTPLRLLKNSMDEYAQKEIGETRIRIVGIGEFKSLSEHFNNMTQRISRLMKAYKEEVDEKNRQRMKALSAQLTPHFIYNALNTIKWVAVLNHQEKIQHLVESLVNIFMNSARADDETYTLGDELELIKNYAVIQKARFMNFELEIEAEDGCQDCRIRKLLIQPIVENAIVHGLNRGKVKDGRIWIKAWMDEELHISVEDKGIGFDVEKWRNCPKKNEEHTNIGVINVEEIICLEYGQDYGLNIESALGRGTKVIYTLPRKMRNDTRDYCR
ncbi:sensor histidine kinase [Schaedlerella arabinosiphila]|nr:histidine kinase [Schaedlerella arabinosiphila]